MYRRYKNNLSYFKIISPVLFEEVQRIGSKKVVRLTEAKLYPEKMFIRDLLYHYEEMAYATNEQEYEAEKA